MKYSNLQFIAKANIKGNRKSNTIRVLMIFFVLSITLISSYAVSINTAVNEFKHDYRALSIEATPIPKPLDETILNNIKDINNVKNVVQCKAFRDQIFDIVNISDSKSLNKEIKQKDGYVQTWSLIGDEKRNVISGKALDDSEPFSCIIPSSFYPFDDESDNGNKPNYISGNSLLGKTITVRAFNNQFEDLYNYVNDSGDIVNEWLTVPALEFKLKIVGVYYLSPNSYGSSSDIYISEETAVAMEKQELTSAGINLKSKSDPISIWWNTPSLRSHYIILDEYDDFEDVYNAVQDLGVSCAENREFELYESTTTLATILSFLSVFLFLATFIISAIMIIQSIIFYTKNRKGEIGMIKALGYKNKDIFMYIYFEHLWLSLSGCFIGGVISAIFIAIANFIFSNGDYVYQRYIISWSNYGIFFAISVIVAVLLPLICQLFTLRKINNIQPREAMN